MVSAHGLKIPHTAQMNVGRLVPLAGKRFCDGHTPKPQQGQPNTPIAKVRKGNNAIASDANDALHHLAWIVGRLQCLTQHHIIKSIGRIILQIGIGIPLNDGEPLFDGVMHSLRAQFHASPIHASLTR